MGRVTYRVCGVFDTETCNLHMAGGEHRAYPVLYITNDLRAVNLADYVPDCEGERVRFYRHEEEFVAWVGRMVAWGSMIGICPVLCAYNLMFDLQTVMEALHDRYDMRANAQSSTNVYTLDLYEHGGDDPVLRFWDTFHLEQRGLKAMGATCGFEKALGDWDYSLVRTPETPLTERELHYAKVDVQVIPAYLRWLCEVDDWLEPSALGVRVLTKTSLVRQMARHKFGNLKIPRGAGKKRLRMLHAFEELCKAEFPRDYRTYGIRRACFRGGWTLTAGAFASEVQRDVISLDVTSMHHLYLNGRRVGVGYEWQPAPVLQAMAEQVVRRDVAFVLRNFAWPFGLWFHARVTFAGLRLRAGSAFEAWQIGLIPRAKMGRVPMTYELGGDDERAVAADEGVRASGWTDAALNPTYAFGKLMSADVATLHVSEVELWSVAQVYKWDSMEVECGEATTRSILPPEYVSLQSNYLFGLKQDAKALANKYDGTPYAGDIPASVPSSIADAVRAGSVTREWVRGWYGNSVKGRFNGIYGTQAMDELKPDYMVAEDAELVVDQDTRARCDEDVADGRPRHCKVLYHYGLRIVGGSRMHLVIAICLIWDALGDGARVLGGDTDSLKVALSGGVTARDVLEALKPLHDAADAALDLCQARIRRNWPDLASDLAGVGHFELEPASPGRDAYEWHMEAWNKARVSVVDGCAHVTCAGLSRPQGRYHMERWLDARIATHGVEDALKDALGYNVCVSNDICHALEHYKPRHRARLALDVTDHLGNVAHVDTHEAIALYDSPRWLGDTSKPSNADNVTWIRSHGREVDTRERWLGVRRCPATGEACLLAMARNETIMEYSHDDLL